MHCTQYYVAPLPNFDVFVKQYQKLWAMDIYSLVVCNDFPGRRSYGGSGARSPKSAGTAQGQEVTRFTRLHAFQNTCAIDINLLSGLGFKQFSSNSEEL